MARPSKLTAAVRDEIALKLASGCSLETAAAAVGVHPRTLERWLVRGAAAREQQQAGGKPGPAGRAALELLELAETAIANVEVEALAAIRRASLNGVWQASAWLLERQFPDRYAGAARRRGRPPGATSAPDRPASGQQPPPRIRLRAVK